MQQYYISDGRTETPITDALKWKRNNYKMSHFKELIDQYEVNVYPKRDVVIVKGKDAKLWDENGKEYIDCAAGIGVATIGHCNEKVVEAITDQAKNINYKSGNIL